MSSSGDDRSSVDRDRSARNDPREESTDEHDRPETVRGWLHWFWTVDRGSAMVVREFLVSVGAVVLVGLLLFSVSGVWPPMVAIESGSMQPHMQPNDLVFLSDNDRFVNDAAHTDTGVVTREAGQETDYRKFGAPGDVIVYTPDGNDGQVPVIHRAHFWVEAGENWYDRADEDHVGSADSCAELRNCPAPNSGFITKGDNGATNQRYDQVRGLSEPVKADWVIGTAEVRVPWLGWIRLQLAELGSGATAQIVFDPNMSVSVFDPGMPSDTAVPVLDRGEPIERADRAPA